MKAKKSKDGKLHIKVKKGLLHEKMGIADDKKISTKALSKEKGKADRTDNATLKKEVVFAENARKWKK